jgi:hypothetical protein
VLILDWEEQAAQPFNILVERYMWVVGNGIGLPRRKF